MVKRLIDSAQQTQAPPAASPKTTTAPDATSFRREDWLRLHRMRQAFWEGGRPAPWQDERDMELYDAVFAPRIVWKWASALKMLAGSGNLPVAEVLWDWGCGTGQVAAAVAEMLTPRRVFLLDAHPEAVRFALNNHAHKPWQALAGTPQWPEQGQTPHITLLISHVLSELDEAGWKGLRAALVNCHTLLCVEPGEKRASGLVVRLRAELLEEGWRVLAPCPHHSACPMLSPSHESDWCHFFAALPPEVHHSAHWRAVAEHLELDLRSLSYCCLFMTREEAPKPAAPKGRVLGRVRVNKAVALVECCTPEGIRLEEVAKRTRPALYKALRRRPEHLSGQDAGTCGVLNQ